MATLALLWGSSFLWIKVALRGFPPIHITSARLALGAVVLLAWLYANGKKLPEGPMLWLHLTAAATVANVAPYLLFAFGEQQVDSSVAGMLNATTPLWTTLLAVLVRQESRPNAWKVAGLALGASGTLLIFAPWQTGSQFLTLGGLACLLAAVSYAVSYLYMARFLAPRRLSALELSASQLLVAMVISAAMTPLLGGWQPPEWRSDAVLGLIVLGVMSTGAAYVINYQLIQDDGATAASVVVYLLPAVAILLGALALRETPTVHAVAGVSVVLVGVALARRRSPDEADPRLNSPQCRVPPDA